MICSRPLPRLSLAFWVASGLCAPLAGHAQILDQYVSPLVFGTGVQPGVTVLSRQRPEFDSAGIRVGSLFLRPSLVESAGYESNVLGTRPSVGSAVVETNGIATLASNWSRNSLQSRVVVDDYRYLDQPRQSYTNYTAQIGGTIDVGRDVAALQYQHQHLNQTPRDLDTPRLQSALSFDVDEAMASYRVNLNRLFITPALDVARYSYSNGVADGLPYIQTYRDRVQVSPTVTFGYELAPRRDVVVVLRDGHAAYDNAPSGLPRRDYDQPAVFTGLDYDISGPVRLRMLLGYEARVFSNAAYKTVQGPAVEVGVTWNPTGLTTFTGSFTRHIQDTTDESVAAATLSSVTLTADHEYLRNVLLHASLSYNLVQYGQGIGSQTLYDAGASVTYLANRNLDLSARYDLQVRQSNQTGQTGIFGQTFGESYNDHRVLLQVRLRL